MIPMSYIIKSVFIIHFSFSMFVYSLVLIAASLKLACISCSENVGMVLSVFFACCFLGTKRSKSSVGKALLTFLGVYPSALNIGSREYAMMCMLDVKGPWYLFPLVM